ncbi:ABC transporter permease [Conexibacter sp. W3-3-2]|uniref:ABC transporter permease n=1 Tax=Conexibacter sp. W3-3-2 TaxID=2675227 RepID=UPI0012B8D186|nr:ABC transporter permease [Conexibacter sp. W3-3-2]MTD43665.1 ABC transporter permease [Conexibacter sp. W3-3-2]
MLLVGLPFFFITRSVLATELLPRTVQLPGGATTLTTMRDVHGAVMTAITISFLAGLVGVFVMQSALQADRRLVLAGFRPTQVLGPRLLVVAATTVLVLVVSLGVTALSFTPRQWSAFALGNLLVGTTYGLLGTLAGAVVGRLGATYLVLFGAMLDLGVVQNPMFGAGEPPVWAAVLPGYASGRVIVDGAFADDFQRAPNSLSARAGWWCSFSA